MKKESPDGFKTKFCMNDCGGSLSVFSCPITFTRMPPSNIGWQSMEVTMCAILWKVREFNFSIILAVPCICCPSKLRKLCSALYSLANSPLEAGLSNRA